MLICRKSPIGPFLASALTLFLLLLATEKTFANHNDRSGRKPKGIKKNPGRHLIWEFPIQRCHAGIPMGNGRQGILLWGSDSVMKITLAHAGFWDRRWTKEPDTTLRYHNLVRLLQQNDEKSVKELFQIGNESKLKRPRQLGGALLEIPMPQGWRLQKASLSLQDGTCEIYIQKKGMPVLKIDLIQYSDANITRIRFPTLFHRFKTPEIRPASEFLSSEFTTLGIPQAEKWTAEVSRFFAVGITQKLPQDPSLGIMCAWKEKNIWLTSGLGPESSKGSLIGKLENFQDQPAEQRTEEYWKQFWESCPKLQLPDPQLAELYEYGLYKMAASAHPLGPPLSLQGPFMEHYQLPPWSNDYHFNINVQMAYTPFLSTGQLQRMAPLWNMMKNWFPSMQKTGEHFYSRKGAWFLPHATTDEGKTFGSFWTGTIDHGSLAWMSDLAWKYYKFSGDRKFLQEVALPMMEGTMIGYLAQLDSMDSGTRYGFAVSVSPEFKGSRMDAWGKNSSFQLAAFHTLINNLVAAKTTLNQTIPERYAQLKAKTPYFSLIKAAKTLEYPELESTRIGLWEGMDLIESHRHHSHLASVYPFRTADPLDSAVSPVFRNTYYQWSRKGMGSWTGWSVPWASILLSRLNQTNSAISMMHWGKENFINEGRGTLHDVFYPWITTAQPKQVFGPEEITKGNEFKEVMQLDAGFGYIEAIHELLIQNRPDGLHILPAIPFGWSDFTFDGIHTEDGLIVGATVSQGRVLEIRIRSRFPTKVRIRLPGNKWTLNGQLRKGFIYEGEMGSGEIQVLKAEK